MRGARVVVVRVVAALGSGQSTWAGAAVVLYAGREVYYLPGGQWCSGW
ncbi:MAG TPA: hypothetical protein VM143_13405 [Acidimicrobiales bacterium]|nr:hypothetical protein [Acidimicrobiales bacterium]